MGDQPPSAIGRQMGTLIAPTNAFNDRGLVVRDLYWVQRLFDARVRILIGRGDPSDYVGATWMQNVNNSFVNRSFSANPAVPFPGHGPKLVSRSAQPTFFMSPLAQTTLTAGPSGLRLTPSSFILKQALK